MKLQTKVKKQKLSLFHGAIVGSTYGNIDLLIKKTPDNVVNNSSEIISDKMLSLTNFIETSSPGIHLALSNLISRTDDRRVSLNDEQLTCVCFATRY